VRRAARPAVVQLRSPDVMSSAEASNSWCEGWRSPVSAGQVAAADRFLLTRIQVRKGGQASAAIRALRARATSSQHRRVEGAENLRHLGKGRAAVTTGSYIGEGFDCPRPGHLVPRRADLIQREAAEKVVTGDRAPLRGLSLAATSWRGVSLRCARNRRLGPL
jgi:hypothetical protein